MSAVQEAVHEALEHDQANVDQSWVPQEGPQLDAIQHAYVEELLYGGARGGGKSDFLLGDFAYDVAQPWGQYHKGILFRKTYKQLQDIVGRALEIFPAMFPGVKHSDKGTTWKFPNGAELRLRHMEHAHSWLEYQGQQFTWIGFDELGEWADATPYLRMHACLRSAHHHPYKRIRATANPGGAGHAWLKEYFHIDTNPKGYVIFEPELEHKEMIEQILQDQGLGSIEDIPAMRRMFIPSKVKDNKILLENDPSYIARLFNLGSEEMVKAWLDGDWEVFAGSYFTEFNTRHIIKPFEVPTHWVRFRAMDSGSYHPFCVLWIAVSDGHPVYDIDGSSVTLPRGALLVYREWYGADKPNVGLKLSENEIADGIVELEAKDIDPVTKKSLIEFGVIDPAAATREKEIYANKGLNFTNATNKRIDGWRQLRNRLVGEDRKPMIYMFDTCVNLIRTLPHLQHDRHKPEDVDTTNEDHAADALRYGCMARPWVRDIHTPMDSTWPAQTINKGQVITTGQTINEMIEERRQQRLSEQ